MSLYKLAALKLSLPFVIPLTWYSWTIKIFNC